jgi:hypothetical protein
MQSAMPARISDSMASPRCAPATIPQTFGWPLTTNKSARRY